MSLRRNPEVTPPTETALAGGRDQGEDLGSVARRSEGAWPAGLAGLARLPLWAGWAGWTALSAVLFACGAPTTDSDKDSGAGSPASHLGELPMPAAGQVALDADWSSEGNLAFEERVAQLAQAAGGLPLEWDGAALALLAEGLDEEGMTATRAAVLLGHDDSPASSRILLARLETRHQAASRALDAGDVVAAGALARRELQEDWAVRLAELAAGSEPHPDLEIRVECAAAALQFGDIGGVPEFLVRVLRTETPAMLEDPGDWERVTTLAWAKGRASVVLAAYLGVVNDFRPDGSWEHQMEAAGRFAAGVIAARE